MIFTKKNDDESALSKKEERDLKQFKIVDNELPEWLESENDFNEVKRLIDDIRIDINKIKVSNGDKNVFKDLNRLITGINDNKVKKEDVVKRLEKSMFDLGPN